MVFFATDYPLGGLLATIAFVAVGVLWIYLIVTVFVDLFARWDMSGWFKTGWAVLVLILPVVGPLIYLVTQSKSMAERKKADRSPGGVSFDSNELDMPTRRVPPARTTAESPESQHLPR